VIFLEGRAPARPRHLFVFFGLWNGVKKLLLHILEMRRKETPPSLAPSPISG